MSLDFFRFSGLSRLDRYLRRRYTGRDDTEPKGFDGYYSPLPDLQEVERRADELFSKKRTDLGPSIDLRVEHQIALLRELAGYYGDFDWPDQPGHDHRFYLNNGFFLAADALALHACLRHYRPNRVIEIGAGFSTALMLDVDDRFLGKSLDFTVVEPEPDRLQQLLRPEDNDRLKLLRARAQDVPLGLFDDLEPNDFLFIDSSHVAKVGSDVNHLLFEVIPRLAPGVIVHIHDIMWPFEYPKAWILEGRAWNEAYMVRAFLQYNASFQILLFNNFAGYCLTDLVRELMPRFLENKGGSLWLRKIG